MLNLLLISLAFGICLLFLKIFAKTDTETFKTIKIMYIILLVYYVLKFLFKTLLF